MMKVKRKLALGILLVLTKMLVAQQPGDTTLLSPQSLNERDIQTPQEGSGKAYQMVNGSSLPIEAFDSPFSTYIITKDEIRRNGYETLVDALKMVPGIQVSQPGSANEGETFLMRGLLGNGYAKILINDVPIKPVYLPTMPIGAQLPIREAERIEITFGTGSVLQGCDGAAGVINIITKDSDKPVFMQADLSAGGGGYNSVNVMFGGRLGKDKRIFKYFAYGSYTFMEGRNITQGHYLNNVPSTYTVDSSYYKSPNYLGGYDTPVISNIPHLSRKFGLNLTYKRFTFTAEAMYRRDHSSLGLNPAAFSYSNPQTFTGESILRMNLRIYKEKTKKGRVSNRQTNLSYIQYSMDSGSSILALYPQLADLLKKGAASAAFWNGNPDSISVYYNTAYDQYLTGARYYFGHSVEGRLEHIRNYRLFKKMTYTLGVNYRFANGRPRNILIPRTVVPSKNRLFGYTDGFIFDKTTYSFISQRYLFGEQNTFSQLFYNGKKIKLVGGTNLVYQFFSEDFSNVYEFFSPQLKLAGLWKIKENINLRASWGKTYTAANGFQTETSRYIQDFELFNTIDTLKAEKSKSWEIGGRWQSKNQKLSFDIAYFGFHNENLIRYGHQILSFGYPNGNFEAKYGYRNLPNSSMNITGLQASFSAKFTLLERFQTEQRLSFFTQDSKLKADGRILLKAYDLQMPEMRRIWQYSLDFKPNEKTSILLSTVRYFNPNIYQYLAVPPKYFISDLTIRYAFSSRFDGYLRIVNLFNKKYAG
ncbi:MAG: TonB-dependent receptor, partial [Saprospiraceae bacterium]|nr:TonB-dependent receptor [Saprospiraceae bacterium]